jgi:hypothetical protein
MKLIWNPQVNHMYHKTGRHLRSAGGPDGGTQPSLLIEQHVGFPHGLMQLRQNATFGCQKTLNRLFNISKGVLHVL